MIDSQPEKGAGMEEGEGAKTRERGTKKKNYCSRTNTISFSTPLIIHSLFYSTPDSAFFNPAPTSLM